MVARVVQPSCHPCIDKIFSWLQEEVSINLVNEIENCLTDQEKTNVYGLPLEDVASYRSKMIHLVEVRCIIFQRTFVGGRSDTMVAPSCHPFHDELQPVKSR